MKVKDVMTTGVEAVSNDLSVQVVAQKMAELDIGFLPVINETEIVGTVTDRDIVVRCLGNGLDPHETTIGEIMTAGAEMIDEDEDVREASRIMKQKQIRRLLVRGPHNRVVGVLSLGDLVVETGDEQLGGETLEKVSQPTHSS